VTGIGAVLEAGLPFTLNVLVVPVPCSHPEYAPLTSYQRGCRCDRCYAGVLASRARHR